MFGSEVEHSRAECYHSLLDCERALGEWERVLAKRHPETLSVADLNQMRADLLRNVAAIRKLVQTMTELI
jgi:hypothetical protein